MRRGSPESEREVKIGVEGVGIGTRVEAVETGMKAEAVGTGMRAEIDKVGTDVTQKNLRPNRLGQYCINSRCRYVVNCVMF